MKPSSRRSAQNSRLEKRRTIRPSEVNNFQSKRGRFGGVHDSSVRKLSATVVAGLFVDNYGQYCRESALTLEFLVQFLQWHGKMGNRC
jgi:hypothetical protein